MGSFMKKKNKNKKRIPKPILLDPNYPIGHATGLTEQQWRDFADNYVPHKKSVASIRK